MKGQKKPARRTTPRRKKVQTQSRATQTLMKVSSGDGLRNWVTLRLPAWLLVSLVLLLMLIGLALVVSPEFGAKVVAAWYEFTRRLADNSQ
jgi:hypothetical protein